MMSVVYRILILLYDMLFITGSDLFLGATPAVCDLTHIHRVIKHTLYKAFASSLGITSRQSLEIIHVYYGKCLHLFNCKLSQ